eukprot:1157473-Pelagomonas_calceolata.AAC.4
MEAGCRVEGRKGSSLPLNSLIHTQAGGKLFLFIRKERHTCLGSLPEAVGCNLTILVHCQHESVLGDPLRMPHNSSSNREKEGRSFL